MYQPFNSQDSVLLLIDHQVGTMGWVGSTSFDTMKKNALLLGRPAPRTAIRRARISEKKQPAHLETCTFGKQSAGCFLSCQSLPPMFSGSFKKRESKT